MNDVKQPDFRTIRQTAKLGVVSEYCLRLMNARGELPCIHVGNRTYVNVDVLMQQLSDVGKGHVNS